MVKNLMVLLIVITSLILTSGISYSQENYRSKFSMRYSSFEDDGYFENKIYSLTSEIYFSEVDPSGHPYAETVFFERVGSVQLLVAKEEAEISPFTDVDGPRYGATLTYMKPESPIVVQGRYIKSDLNSDSRFDGDVDWDFYKLGLGYYLSDELLVGFGYAHSITDFTIPIIAVDQTSERYTYGVSAKFVKENPNGTTINIEGAVNISQLDNDIDDGTNIVLGASGDYYFDRKISLGAGLAMNTGDYTADEGKTLALNFNAFINPSFSIGAGLEKFFANNGEGEDSDYFSFGASARF